MFLPDHETDIDLISYSPIAKTVVELLRNHPPRPMTLGIHGNWGAGKSSVLKMIQTELAEDEDVACLWFNGWTFQGFDDAKTVLIEAIIDELQRNQKFSEKIKDRAEELIKRVNWLKIAKSGLKYAPGAIFTLSTGIPSPDLLGQWFFHWCGQTKADLENLSPDEVQKIFDKAPGFIKEPEKHQVPEHVHFIREEFQKMLEEAGIKQLVVLIDDLDRCLPETAISTLEAIRLFLFVPGTAFVIGADEAMIEYSVGRHFPDLPLSSGPTTYTRNYLEKLIQVPFRIPSLGVEETRIYVLLLMVQCLVGENHTGFKTLLEKAAEALKKPWIKTDLTQEDIQSVDPERTGELNQVRLLSTQIGPILAEGTKGNPRQIKRFLNSMMLRCAVANARGFGNEINQSALAKLMLAERFKPDLYEHLILQSKSTPDGKATVLSIMEAPPDDKDKDTGTDKGSKTKSTKAATVEPVDENKKWLENSWIQDWTKIEPKLADLDLRPYIFVSQDKRVRFEAHHLDEDLSKLLTTLQSPNKIALRHVASEIQSLTPENASSLFQMLRELVERNGDLQNKPDGVDGIVALAQHHPHIRPMLLKMLDSLPIENLGIWVVSGWNAAFPDEVSQAQFNKILQRWHSDTNAAPLKTAIGAALSSTNGGGS